MRSCAVIFETSRFNVSQPQPHFINPCCYGEDAALWLADAMREKGLEVRAPGQEDWGWYLDVGVNGAWYMLAIGGEAKNEGAPSANYGVWQIMIVKQRSLREKLLGKNRMSLQEPVLQMLKNLLISQADIGQVEVESN